MSKSEKQGNYLSPKQFLKSRRPKQFSDTIMSENKSIDRAQLEYYLSTLSNRSQEKEFECYAKRLCELKICPNLQSNTGPSGGGDGKVDSQTYPVSPTTQLGWYIGASYDAAKDRWAFAFSIKKDWRAKLKSDIKKIAETGRGYKVAYFVTNQYVPSKKRSDLEDELSNKYSISIRILDATWLLDETFKNNYQQIAIDELGIQTSEQSLINKGDLDTKRAKMLEDCDKQIEEEISRNKITKNTLDLSIKSAILSRQLELPRHETDGRFSRATRLANDVGDEFSRFEVAYQHAWTAFWWFEDFKAFKSLFLIAEKEVISTNNVYNLEKLVNLWFLLTTIREHNKNLVPKGFYDQHTNKLKNKLTEILKDTSKMTAPLYAKSLLLLVDLKEKAIADNDELGRILTDIEQVVKESQNFVGFPLRPLIGVLIELSGLLDDYPEYERLFITMSEIVSRRDGELAAANMALARGSKQLQAGKNYEAIKTLGGVLRNVHKYESKDDAIRALYMMGVAYKNVGLYWAARGSFLSAGSLATDDFWNHGEVTLEQMSCYEELKKLELRLGRLPHLLEWNRIDLCIKSILVSQGEDQNKFDEAVMMFDLMLGVVFLRMDSNELKKYQSLPDTLLSNGLEHSRIALLHALGRDDELPNDFADIVPVEDREKYFKGWAVQYSSEHHPEVLDDLEDDEICLFSNILGCTVNVTTKRQENCLELAESLLAAMESILATSTLYNAISTEQFAQVNITFSSQQNELVTYSVIDNDDRPTVNVVCGKFNPHRLGSTEQSEIKDSIFKINAELITRIIMFKDFKREFKAILEEGGTDRALSFTSTFVRLGNVLAPKPKHKTSDWIKNQKEYTLNQPKGYRGIVALSEDSPPIIKEQPSSSRGLYDNIKHTDMRTVSVIREQLWNDAQWEGAGFATSPDQPPILMFLFKNAENGKKIFSAWRERFSNIDKEDDLRITIVRGIDKKNPFYYRIGVGANIKKELSSARLVGTIVRSNMMTPTNSDNLDRFLADYKKYGCFWIVPAAFNKSGKPDMYQPLSILKEKVVIRDAWEIGINDLDSSLIRQGDNPIIPKSEIEKSPVIELIQSRMIVE